MPLYYVRAVKNNVMYKEVKDRLEGLEASLIAHGAKLEKRERGSSKQE
jgi:hypothetical protein